jgi:hypothetical protein
MYRSIQWPVRNAILKFGAGGIRFLADGSKDRYGKGVDANIETAQFELLATPSHQTAAGVKYPGDI